MTSEPGYKQKGRFSRRFLYGTPHWNALTRLAVLMAFVGGLVVSAIAVALVHSRTFTVTAIVTSGLALVAVAGLFFYWGARGASEARALDVERARAEAESQITARLREALEPKLPKLRTLGFSATYVPASTGEIGGDWYDAFELPDGRIMFSIGDVAGHGVEAAATMSRARQAIIAVALDAQSPGEIFERANRLLLIQDTKFATAICGYIEPTTMRVDYATAGHPPALLVSATGDVTQLQYDGLPLGVANESYRSFEVRVENGGMLVLYTDGLLEYDRDLLAGEKRILAAVASIGVQQLDNPAEAIRDAIFTDYAPTDDVAIMTIAFERLSAADGDAGEPRWAVGFRGVRTPMLPDTEG